MVTYREALIKRSELVHSLMSGSDVADHDGMLQATTALLDELQTEKSQNRCSVCMDQEIDCVLMPCRHRAMCQGCSNMCQRCPLCRASITERLKVFG